MRLWWLHHRLARELIRLAELLSLPHCLMARDFTIEVTNDGLDWRGRSESKPIGVQFISVGRNQLRWHQTAQISARRPSIALHRCHRRVSHLLSLQSDEVAPLRRMPNADIRLLPVHVLLVGGSGAIAQCLLVQPLKVFVLCLKLITLGVLPSHRNCRKKISYLL